MFFFYLSNLLLSGILLFYSTFTKSLPFCLFVAAEKHDVTQKEEEFMASVRVGDLNKIQTLVRIDQELCYK